MRVRTQENMQTVVSSYRTTTPGGTFIAGSTGETERLCESNVIHDTVRRQGEFNPVFHTKSYFNCSPVELSYDNGGNITYSTWVPPSVDYWISEQGLKNILYQYGMDQFLQEAIEKMTPSMESGFNLGNFLYELREFTNLFKVWEKGKSLYRNLSKGSLNYSFGWIPFIGDMKRLYEGLESFKGRLLSFKLGAGRLQRRYYSKELSNTVSEAEWHQWDDEIYTPSTNRLKRIAISPTQLTMTCTMEYTYQLPELDRLYTSLRGFLDTIGAQLDLYTVWEAIPYSFVVDWFVNVGDYLKQFRAKWIEPTLYIKSVGFSAKWEGEYTYLFKRCVYMTHPSEWGTVGQGRQSAYLRKKVDVDDTTFNLAIDGNVTLRKFVLGSLLLEQRAFR